MEEWIKRLVALLLAWVGQRVNYVFLQNDVLLLGCGIKKLLQIEVRSRVPYLFKIRTLGLGKHMQKILN